MSRWLVFPLLFTALATQAQAPVKTVPTCPQVPPRLPPQLAIADKGLVIVGGDEDGDHFAFDLIGKLWDDDGAQAALTRFDRWSAHLALREHSLRSLGKLFPVDRRA